MAFENLSRRQKKYNTIQANPLDALSIAFETQGWPFERPSQDLIAFETHGGWCNYNLQIYRSINRGLMYFSSRISCRVPAERQPQLYKLLCEINTHMCLGHFDLCPEDGTPTFRHSLPLSAVNNDCIEPIEDIVFIALHECERFFPAFQLVLWAGKTPEEALQASMLECEGNA
ncbi:MAG: YbjN domain-containing protein [Pseudomonadota bacterium]